MLEKKWWSKVGHVTSTTLDKVITISKTCNEGRKSVYYPEASSFSASELLPLG
jgi:hypothetical protein